MLPMVESRLSWMIRCYVAGRMLKWVWGAGSIEEAAVESEQFDGTDEHGRSRRICRQWTDNGELVVIG
jgi:hypothetical protein